MNQPTCAKCGGVMTPGNSRVHPEWFLHDACLPDEVQQRPTGNRFDETRRLLIEMRKYIVHHGLLIGECVAWSKLKDLYSIVNEGMEVAE